MKYHRASLVKDSLDLLRQVRASVANDSNRSLVVAIDEAIVKLELYLNEGVADPGRIGEILKVLAQGLAAIPVLHRLIDLARDQ